MIRASLFQRALLFYGTRMPDHPRKWWLHGQLRRTFGVAVDCENEVVRSGLKWSLNPSDFADESLFWLGTKDTWDVEHLKRLVEPDDVILDVGANFGYYGLTLAKTLQEQCSVHAIEPDPHNFDRLRRHIEGNRLGEVVQAHSLGVSDHEETVKLNRHPGNSGHTAVAVDGEVEEIKLTTLDHFCDGLRFDRLDVVVLDVEGFEERALRGARQTLDRFRPLVCVELFPPVMQRQATSPAAAAGVLEEQGYHLYVAHRSHLVPMQEMPAGDNRVNVFAFHRNNLPESLVAGAAGSH